MKLNEETKIATFNDHMAETGNLYRLDKSVIPYNKMKSIKSDKVVDEITKYLLDDRVTDMELINGRAYNYIIEYTSYTETHDLGINLRSLTVDQFNELVTLCYNLSYNECIRVINKYFFQTVYSEIGSDIK